ncbi:MAG TPA: cytochrome C [Candidatus Kapabacteria bacterium]|nr:cytochrome C [Candidatus Kapabacteria bacterium]
MSEGLQNFWLIVSKPDNVPIVLMIFLISFYCWLAYKQARRNDRYGIEEAKQADKVQVWPYLVKVEFLVTIIVMIILTVWSITINAPLEEPANPTLTPNPSKAPWYFLGLQEMLVYFDPWIAGVMLPTFIIIGLILVPYLDINPKGNGYYTFKDRPFAISIYSIGFLILWVALIVLGTFMRGPGWYFFWPWEFWDTHRVVALTNVDLFEKLFNVPTKNVDGSFNLIQVLLGGVLIIGYLVVLPMWVWKKYKDRSLILKAMGVWKYATTAALFLMMAGLPIKMFLRLAFNIKYVWVFGFGHDLFFDI